MAVNYNNTLKDNRMTQVVNAIDAGVSAGTLEIGTSGMGTVLAAITLADPSATVSSGVLTFSGTPLSTSASATGTAAEAQIRDSNAVVVISGLTVATSGADINLNSTSISSGQTVEITSGTITHG